MTALLARDQTDALAKVQKLIDECAAGISDREAEAIAFARLWVLEIDVAAAFAVAREMAASARAKVNAEPVVEAPPIAPRAAPNVWRPDWAKPKQNTAEDRGRQKPEAALKVSGEENAKAGFAERLDKAVFEKLRLAEPGEEAEPETEPDEEPEPETEVEPPECWELPKLGTAPVLSRQAQLDNAKAFTRDKLTLSAKGKRSGPGTYFFDESWWQWNGSFYEKAPEQRIVDMVCEYLDKATSRGGEDGEGLVRFKPKTGDVAALMTFLRSNVGLDDRAIPPRWLDGRPAPRAEGLLAFRNVLVDVTTGKTYPHEPWLWMHDGVDFDYDPRARCPQWEKFLLELFPRDEEAREMIEEELGYGMTIDNQFEKAALWVGPPRSGRGTLARIQELLVGPNGYTSLNIHTWHNNENSRQGLVGKRVGIFHDMRLKPPKQYGSVSYDTGGVDPQSQQLLLEYISGDLTEIGRKYLEAWKGEPFTKFRLISNKVPNFNDEVLVTRFNVIEFTKSFLGKENPALKRQLLPAELPGIANRCLAAYRRLLKRGRFVQPRSGLLLLHKVKAAVSPWAAFMDFYWEPDPKGEGTLVSVFVETFRHWCMKTENFDLVETSGSNIIQQINKVPGWQWLRSWRPSDNTPRRYRVKLKAGAKLPEAKSA